MRLCHLYLPRPPKPCRSSPARCKAASAELPRPPGLSPCTCRTTPPCTWSFTRHLYFRCLSACPFRVSAGSRDAAQHSLSCNTIDVTFFGTPNATINKNSYLLLLLQNAHNNLNFRIFSSLLLLLYLFIFFIIIIH